MGLQVRKQTRQLEKVEAEQATAKQRRARALLRGADAIAALRNVGVRVTRVRYLAGL